MIGLRNSVSAAEMAALAARDPQFRMPLQPRLVDGLVFVPFEDGLLVDGAPERQVFRGSGARTLLPGLLSLLNGRRSVAEIAAELPEVPVDAIHGAVALLYSRGLLDDGAAAAHPDWCRAFPDLTGFFHRHVDVTRVHRSAGESLTSLRMFRLLVLGEPATTGFVAEQLALCGMEHLSIADRLDDRLDPAPDLILVLVGDLENREELRALDEICAERGIPWLRAALHGSIVEIGPRFERGETACYCCFERLHEFEKRAVPPGEARLQAWSSLVAAETVMLASRLGELASGHGMTQFDLDTWSVVRVRPPMLPGCSHCRRWTGEPDADRVSIAYEQAVTARSKQFVHPKANQVHFRAIQRDLQQVPPRYLDYVVEALPADECESAVCEDRRYEPTATPSGAVDRALIARMARRGGGYRSLPATAHQSTKRWAPSAGNLGSPQVYIVVSRAFDLPSAVYYYDAARDVLVRLGSAERASRLARLLQVAGSAGATTEPSFWILLTAAFGRLGAKYGLLSYRLAHLDAGVALAQMEAVAEEVGLVWVVHEHWDDALLRSELRLDEQIEPIVAVAAVSDSRAGASCR